MIEGNYPAARDLYCKGLTLMRELGDRRSIISSLQSLGTIATIQGDLTAAQSAYEEGLHLSRESATVRASCCCSKASPSYISPEAS